MYFEHIEEKYFKVVTYNRYQTVKKREIKRLGFDEYRLFADMNYINNFINHICTVNYFDIDINWLKEYQIITSVKRSLLRHIVVPIELLFTSCLTLPFPKIKNLLESGNQILTIRSNNLIDILKMQ